MAVRQLIGDPAAGAIRHPSWADRTRHTLSYDELVALALSGGDVLAVSTLPHAQGIQRDGTDDTIRLDLQHRVPAGVGYTTGGRYDGRARAPGDRW